MKTFRILGMALFAILMCVNLSSCSSSDDDPTEEPEEGGVIVSGKKIVKFITESGDWKETWLFKYDNKGRLIEAIDTDENNGTIEDSSTHRFAWGDDAIIVKSDYKKESEIYTIKNELLQNCNDGASYSYNQSNRINYLSHKGFNGSAIAIWEGDKLVAYSEDDTDFTLTYEKDCKKGYSPLFLFLYIYDYISEPLLLAHPEILGMRTSQLPISVTTKGNSSYNKTNISTITYEFDKEGYISRIVEKHDGNIYASDTYTYTLTWE